MKRLGAFLITAVLMVALAGCAAAAVQYSLTISNTEGGEVTTPGEEITTYYDGEVVSLIAVAENGYRFVEWTGNVSTIADVDAAATTITMNDNYSIVANFYETPVTYYTLTLAVHGSGSTSPSVGQHTYAAGTVVSITAAPTSRFVNWTGSVGTVALVVAARTTVTMNADYSIMANFEEEVMTFPGPDVGETLRGDIREDGYIFPSDLQRHSFFSGIT
jgi:hypothetical protein